MNHSTVDFMEVRKLVLQHELEPGLQPRIDDAALFRASNEIIKVKIAICNLRERAMVINQKLSLAPHLEELQMQQIEEEGSIWFDEATFSELLCSFPVAVARCPDLLCPEILVPGVLTTKHAGSLLQACLMYVPILRKQCIELLAEFILKCTQIRHVSMCYKPQDPLISHCLQQSYSVMESFFCSDTHMAFILREALVRRCICANIVIQITVGVLKDGVDFLNRIIFSDGEICQWFISCIRSREKTTEMGFSSPEVEKLPMFTEPLTSIHLDDASQLKEATVLQLRKALHVAAKAAFHEDQWSNHLYCYLKLYCVLVHLGGLQPIHEEVIFWLHALIFSVDSSGGNDKGPGGKNLIPKRRFELGVSFLFLVPGFHTSSFSENLFRECINFFLAPAISSMVPHEQGSVIAVWLVVQILLQSSNRVSEYCSKVIGINIRIASTCWDDVCRAAHETGITSRTSRIVQAASFLRPSGPICSIKSDQVVLECLFQLLKSGHIVRCGVDISESIKHCILLSEEPIHPMLVQTIEMFAEASCSLTSANSSNEDKMQSLPFSFLADAINPLCSWFMILETVPETGGVPSLWESTSVVNHPSNFMKTEAAVPAVLSSFYVLCREKFQQSQGTFMGNSNSLTTNEEISWSKLLRSLPLDKLLAYMESHWLSYEHIFPQWVGLAISLFPEWLRVSRLGHRLEGPLGDSVVSQEFYHCEEQLDMHDGKFLNVYQNRGDEVGVKHSDGNFSIELARQVFKDSSLNQIPALRLLKAIRVNKIYAKNKLELQTAVIEDMLPLLLDKSSSDLLQEAFCEWWYNLEQADTEFLIPLFCRCVATSPMDIDEGRFMEIHNMASSVSNSGLLVSWNLYQDLVEQPLSIIACSTEIYHTPLLSIFLDILMELLVRNRRMCLLASKNDGEVKKEETLRALDTRDSAVCQVLLENWSRMSSLGSTADPMHKAGSLICAFISSLFYSSPSIFRIVHFQGYDMKLIPAVAKGVTSMIHFLEFFEDSLQFLELSVLPFTVVLLSNIIRRYPGHSRSLSTAQKVIKHIGCIDLEMAIKFLEVILEPVAWFAITFPSLEPEVREIFECYLRMMDSGKSSGGAPTDGFRSSTLSALGLLRKGSGDDM